MVQPGWRETAVETNHGETVEIFSDGACTGNPGPGGYGTILRYGKQEKELSGYSRDHHMDPWMAEKTVAQLAKTARLE